MVKWSLRCSNFINLQLVVGVLFIYSLLYISCNHNKSKNQDLTEKLNQLLIQIDSATIPKPKTHYILVSRYGCKGCNQELYSYFDSTQLNFVKLITSDQSIIESKSYKENDPNVIVDKNGFLDRIGFKIGYFAIITTAGGEVTSYTSYKQEDIDDIKKIFIN